MTGSHTYKQILKSSALIGGSSVLNIAIGVIRTKAMAMLLGPSGIGLMGLYGSIIDLTVSIAGMGVNSSGVRQIAEAVGSDDQSRIALTANVLKRISFFLGLLGAVFLIGFSKPVSNLTFGDDHHAVAVAVLSIAVFFNLVSAGQGALVQGMRRISDLAKMGVSGAFLGALISLPTVYFLREDGVAIALALAAAMTILTSWWFSRKVHIQTPLLSASQVGQEAIALLKLGFAFMVSGLLMAVAAYAVRLIVVRKVGFDAAGLYQAAWVLGGLYIGFILQAMGADFYPRLAAIARDNAECNRVVNEQAYVSLLLAGPGVIATLTLAPLVIELFYTSKFEGAVEILRWLCFGMVLRVISWPMGFIIVAKNVQNLMIFSELAWTAVYLGLAWAAINSFGLQGAGIAFFGSYIFHVIIVYVIVRRLSGFRWSPANIRTSAFFLALTASVFCSFYVLPPLLAMGFGIMAVLLGGAYSIQALVKLISLNRIQGPALKLMRRFRLATPGHNGSNGLELKTGCAEQKNRPLVAVRWLVLGFIACIAFPFWIYWYEGTYGWVAELESLGFELKTLMFIFQ